MKTIEVVVGKDGSIQIETKGFSGAECEKATAELEKALGTKASNVRTGDYYKAAPVGQQQR